MHNIKKSIIGILGVIGIVAITHASGIIITPNNMNTIIPNFTSKINAINFNRWGNSFHGVVIWSGTQTLDTPQTVSYGETTISCTKKVSGIYYNNQRWAIRRPLDNTTHTALIETNTGYNNIQLTGGLFTDCEGDENAVYGQLTHILTGSLSGQYHLGAGLIYDFPNNNYNGRGLSESLILGSNNQGSWHIYDSAGGIGVLSSAGVIAPPIPPVDPQTWGNQGWGWWGWFIYTHWSNNTNIDLPTTKLCHYDDVPYAANGPFQDTLGHRWFAYIEILRISCLNQGRGRAKGERFYEPNANITRAEVLKTISKILWSTTNDFSIENEQKIFIGNRPFLDTPNWFNHYADFAFKQWLTQWLYTTDTDGNRYLDPDQAITRYEAIKIMMLAYNKISQSIVDISQPSVMGDVIDTNNPYYNYVRQAEVLGFIWGVPQADGGYNFEGTRNLTRAEFAKIVGVPFSEQLFDIEQVVYQSEILHKTIEALNNTESNKTIFIQVLFKDIAQIDEITFIKNFKVPKEAFLEVLYNIVVETIFEE